jgi:membrane protease YdiL (CAAX protease family)
MTTISVLTPARNLEQKTLKPMGLWESLVLFGIPAVALALSLLWLWPALIAAGISRPGSYVFSISLVNTGLIAAALAGYLLEGNPLTWSAFSRRLRLTQMTGRVWLWALVSTLAFGILALLANSLAAMTYKALNFSMPDITPGIMNVWMQGIVLLLNIFGEELWWRGYILPRQELAFGKKTWLIHGVLWACFHVFKWWSVPFMLVTCQIIPFAAQRTKNTWPGIISHLVVNGAGIILAGL